MINFQPDVCMPKDPSGWGQWLTGHFYEHMVMAQKCRALSPSVNVPDYDIFGWRDEPELVQQWLQSHESIHKVIRQACNVSGSDLSLVDFSKDDQFTEWQGDHAQEHSVFRSVLGII